MPQVKPIIKIHCAAAFFAFVSRDINEIADAFDTSDRTVRRWAEDPEWDAALNACGYTGDRNFETQPYRDTERDVGEIFSEAKAVYITERDAGTPQHQLATITSEAVGLPRRRIHEWASKYGWREKE